MPGVEVEVMTPEGKPLPRGEKGILVVKRPIRGLTPGLWGEHDRQARPQSGRALAERLPGSRFDLIPDSGHLPQVEQPERVAEAVRRFALSRR